MISMDTDRLMSVTTSVDMPLRLIVDTKRGAFVSSSANPSLSTVVQHTKWVESFTTKIDSIAAVGVDTDDAFRPRLANRRFSPVIVNTEGMIGSTSTINGITRLSVDTQRCAHTA